MTAPVINRPPPIRAESEGHCNICGVYGPLTEDHVPPQGSLDMRRVWIRRIADAIQWSEKCPATHSQDGPKFKTLCSRCNNTRLGARFDPELIRFSRRVGAIIRAADFLTLPAVVPVEVKVHDLARAVIGHVLAGEMRESMKDKPRKADSNDAFREYFLNDGAPWPSAAHLYFWPYRGRRWALFPAVGVVEYPAMTPEGMKRGTTWVIDVLKFFPVAFCITFDSSGQRRMRPLKPVREIVVLGGIEQEMPIRVPTRPDMTVRPTWPEQPTDDDPMITLVNRNCVIADPLL